MPEEAQRAKCYNNFQYVVKKRAVLHYNENLLHCKSRTEEYFAISLVPSLFFAHPRNVKFDTHTHGHTHSHTHTHVG